MRAGRRNVRDGARLRMDPARRRLLIALPAALLAGSVVIAAERDRVPRRARGGTRIDVRSTGARGDGVSDDTAAFQRAIDALPDAGGTVTVPAGDYLIDPTRRVHLRSRMHLQMARDARLVAKPNAEERTYVLEAARVSDIEISGGHVVGDRDRHLGTTGEWGHGIALYGVKRATLRDVRVSRCWGDGIAIGAKKAKRTDKLTDPSEDIVIVGAVATGNRRQGLTIGHSRDVRVYDSEFADTAGTAPQCGIDIESDRPWDIRRVLVENCRIHGNRGGGIQVYMRAHDVTIRGCTIEDNHGHGILAVGATDGLIESNLIRDNGLVGVGLRARTRNFVVRGNRFGNNATRRRSRSRQASEAIESHIRRAEDTSEITVVGNRFLDAADG